MKHIHFPAIAALMLTAMLISTPASAGWGDALKAAGDAGAKAAGLSYTPSEAEAGIRKVLTLGTDSAVSKLSSGGGFSANPATAIGLPDSLSSLGDAAGLLSTFNSAAESSVPSIGGLFKTAIGDLDVPNPGAMIGGGDTSITSYFEKVSRPAIRKLAKPIVSRSLDAAGMGPYVGAMSMASQGAGFDPVDFVTDKTLDGIFLSIGEKEKTLRSTGGGTSELLKKLF